MTGELRMLAPLAWRNLWRNPRRTVITLLVVAVGLYSILVLAALLQAWAVSSRETSLRLVTGSGQIHARAYLDDPSIKHRMPVASAALRAALDAKPVDAWTARVRVPAVVRSEYKTLPVELLGVDPAGERGVSTLARQIAEGHYLQDASDPGIVLGRHLAQRLKTRVGKRVILLAQSTDGGLAERAYPVVGLFGATSDAEDAYAFTSVSAAQDMLDMGTDISEISFIVGDNTQLESTVKRLHEQARAYDVSSWRQLLPLAAAMNGLMDASVYIWLCVMFVFVAFGIVNTQLMAVFERTREFGLLQAIGMRPGLILRQVLLESALLIGVGVFAGAIASLLTLLLLRHGVDLSFLAKGTQYFGVGQILYPRISGGQFIGFSVLVWALGVLVALWPAWRAARARPVEAMRHVT
jgi:ABC-type lipoprotein release transport system permease subunit